MREIFSFIIIIITIVYNLPLLIKVIKTKDINSLSLTTLILGIFMPLLWFIYTFLYLNDVSLFIVNALCLSQNSFLLHYYFKFKKHEIK